MRSARRAMLLEELKRITSNEQNFITERRELYSRLEVPISVGNTTMYQSSAGLSELLQISTTSRQEQETPVHPRRRCHPQVLLVRLQNCGWPRPSRDPVTQAGNKKGSITSKETGQMVRTLTTAEGSQSTVSSTTRVSQQVCSSAAIVPVDSTGQVQRCKLSSWPMLWLKCKDFEKLIQSVNMLLDARKVSEQVRVKSVYSKPRRWSVSAKSREAAGISGPNC
ncbi:uncharacterized protein N7500_010987 [Penicillium coprophilum]|uniref:uncharacterized protein n=1 Tax=Penicillium coprophilum TaxID=36646 RepID=UPI0023A10B84|nr:uncharacterized protein N7500_010987 [Penicillium coprophilum]KAJ5150798.1 hypothetical protein N7500_010987 [Penicillium coprophilum]